MYENVCVYARVCADVIEIIWGFFKASVMVSYESGQSPRIHFFSISYNYSDFLDL